MRSNMKEKANYPKKKKNNNNNNKIEFFLAFLAEGKNGRPPQCRPHFFSQDIKIYKYRKQYTDSFYNLGLGFSSLNNNPTKLCYCFQLNFAAEVGTSGAWWLSINLSFINATASQTAAHDVMNICFWLEMESIWEWKADITTAA